MAVTTFPTNTEITNLQSGTLGTNYKVAPNETPIPSSKWNNWQTAVQQLVTFLKATSPQFTQESWTSIATFFASWVNYGGSFAPASYRIDSTGRVWLRGAIRDGTTGSIAFTLPTGYRPTTTIYLNAISVEAGNKSATRLIISALGHCTPAAGTIAGANDLFVLDNLSFKN